MVGAGFFESRAATTRAGRCATSTQFAVLALRELFRHRVMSSSCHARPFK